MIRDGGYSSHQPPPAHRRSRSGGAVRPNAERKETAVLTLLNLYRLVSPPPRRAAQQRGPLASGVLGRLAYAINNGLTVGPNLSYESAFKSRFAVDIK